MAVLERERERDMHRSIFNMQNTSFFLIIEHKHIVNGFVKRAAEYECEFCSIYICIGVS